MAQRKEKLRKRNSDDTGEERGRERRRQGDRRESGARERETGRVRARERERTPMKKGKRGGTRYREGVRECAEGESGRAREKARGAVLGRGNEMVAYVF